MDFQVIANEAGLFRKMKRVMERRFLAAKEMIYISNSTLDEEVAYQFLIQKEKFEKYKINERSLKNYKLLSQWLLEEKRLECILPKGGVVCFPRFTKPHSVDIEKKFHSLLIKKYKTMVGPGHWFSMPDFYFRLGFGWRLIQVLLKAGLENLSRSIGESSW